MKKFFTLFLLAVFAWIALPMYAEILEPTCTKLEAKWWMSRYNKELFQWTDHTGHTNTVQNIATNPVVKASGRDCSITFGTNLVWQTYTVSSGHLGQDYSYSLSNIAPGTYTNGLFYTQMTDEQKTELWVAYTNRCIQAYYAHQAEKYADAKFDVSMDPEEYKAKLFEGRSDDDLLPEEKSFLMNEYHTYYREWLRINDPDEWDMPFFKEPILTEKQKAARSNHASAAERARARARARKNSK